jgi:putative copper export protein
MVWIARPAIVRTAVVVRAAVVIVAAPLDVDRRRHHHGTGVRVVRIGIAAGVIRIAWNGHAAAQQHDGAEREGGTENTNSLHEGLLVGLL